MKNMIQGMQMLFVAFGALVLVPLLTGLDPSVALFGAGIGTLLFSTCYSPLCTYLSRFFIRLYCTYYVWHTNLGNTRYARWPNGSRRCVCNIGCDNQDSRQ